MQTILFFKLISESMHYISFVTNTVMQFFQYFDILSIKEKVVNVKWIFLEC